MRRLSRDIPSSRSRSTARTFHGTSRDGRSSRQTGHSRRHGSSCRGSADRLRGSMRSGELLSSGSRSFLTYLAVMLPSSHFGSTPPSRSSAISTTPGGASRRSRVAFAAASTCTRTGWCSSCYPHTVHPKSTTGRCVVEPRDVVGDGAPEVILGPETRVISQPGGIEAHVVCAP